MKEVRTWSVIVSTAAGRRSRGGIKSWEITNVIKGLTQGQANDIRNAVFGRMTGQNRIDVADTAHPERYWLAGNSMGDVWGSSY